MFIKYNPKKLYVFRGTFPSPIWTNLGPLVLPFPLTQCKFHHSFHFYFITFQMLFWVFCILFLLIYPSFLCACVCWKSSLKKELFAFLFINKVEFNTAFDSINHIFSNMPGKALAPSLTASTIGGLIDYSHSIDPVMPSFLIHLGQDRKSVV